MAAAAEKASRIRFAQQGISSTFRNGEFAGRTIEEVAAGLRSSAIKADQLPIQVIVRDGVRYTLNNRSLMAPEEGRVRANRYQGCHGKCLL